ncbi:hypothetical protein ACVW00_003040 [Marmoricola sp. URHA0025 HA25]
MADQQGAQVRAVTWRRLLLNRAVLELGAMAVLAVIYNTVRAGGGSNEALAMAHARDIARIEGWVFEHLELNLDHWIIGVPVLAVAACYFYALMHYVMTPTILVLSRRRGGWRYWRGYWALVVGSAIALVIYANWPLAPPRLMPELGTIDVMQHFADAGWWGNAASAPRGLGDATNQFAAMPSLHFGWSLWCGIQMWGLRGPPRTLVEGRRSDLPAPAGRRGAVDRQPLPARRARRRDLHPSRLRDRHADRTTARQDRCARGGRRPFGDHLDRARHRAPQRGEASGARGALGADRGPLARARELGQRRFTELRTRELEQQVGRRAGSGRDQRPLRLAAERDRLDAEAEHRGPGLLAAIAQLLVHHEAERSQALEGDRRHGIHTRTTTG